MTAKKAKKAPAKKPTKKPVKKRPAGRVTAVEAAVRSPAEETMAASRGSDSGAGRPTVYTREAAAMVIETIKASYSEELAKLVLLKVRTLPKTIREICDAHPELPSKQTIYNWLAVNDEFATEFVKALTVRALLYAEDMMDRVYDNSKDWLETPVMADGKPVMMADGTPAVTREPNQVHLLRTRLIVDKVQWYISKLLPRLFGEKPLGGAPQDDEEKVSRYAVPELRKIEAPTAGGETPAPRPKKKRGRRG